MVNRLTFFIISLQDDFRRYIALSTFGFYEHGELDVKFHNFHVENARERGVVSTNFTVGMYNKRTNFIILYLLKSLAFRWTKRWRTQWILTWILTRIDAFWTTKQRHLITDRSYSSSWTWKIKSKPNQFALRYHMKNIKNNSKKMCRVHVNCSPDWPKVHILEKKTEHPNLKPYESNLYPPQRRKRDQNPNCNMEIPMTAVESMATGVKTYSMSVSSCFHLNAFSEYVFLFAVYYDSTDDGRRRSV